MRMRKRNIERAEWARPAVELFAASTGLVTAADGLDTAIIDLLADIMHLCDLENIGFERVVESATMHYEAELKGE